MAPKSSGEGKKPKCASIPKDIPGELELDWAVRLLSLPRTIGEHPETGKPITASIGRYGPYLAHDGKYARLRNDCRGVRTGMNAAVAKLADAASGGGQGRWRGRRTAQEFGPTSDGGEIKLMAGRYGAYVTDGTTNATLPREKHPEDADARRSRATDRRKAAKGPAKKGQGAKKKAPAKKAPAKGKVAAKG